MNGFLCTPSHKKKPNFLFEKFFMNLSKCDVKAPTHTDTRTHKGTAECCKREDIKSEVSLKLLQFLRVYCCFPFPCSTARTSPGAGLGLCPRCGLVHRSSLETDSLSSFSLSRRQLRASQRFQQRDTVFCFFVFQPQIKNWRLKLHLIGCPYVCRNVVVEKASMHRALSSPDVIKVLTLCLQARQLTGGRKAI